MENKQNDIVVIQIATAGIGAFCRLTGLERADFLGLYTPHNVDENIYEDLPQLLITGIISDDTSDVVDLVERLRKKNPQLVVVTFSSCKIPGDCFDRQIPKMDRGAGKMIISAIEDFRKGTFRRKVDAKRV